MDEGSGETRSGDELLQEVAGLARQLAEADTLDETLQRVVESATEYLEHCDGTSMMFIRAGGEIITPAFSSEVARDSDLAQYRTGEGPCLGAIAEQATLVIDDLEEEDRWPAYREAALALGVRSMLGFRLFVAEDTLGALDLYSRRPHAFDDRSRMVGEVFAAIAAVAMKSAISEAGLHAAIASRDVIGQAKGILMERERLTAQQAFDRLREISQRRNVPIRLLADEIAASGEVPDDMP